MRSTHWKTPARSPHAIAGEEHLEGGLGRAHVAYLDLAAEVERRKQAGDSLSPIYRIYLRDLRGSVVSGHTIATESDGEAIKVASIFCHASGAGSASFEIWKGDVPMMSGHLDMPQPLRDEGSQNARQADTELASRAGRAAPAEIRQPLKAIKEGQQPSSSSSRAGPTRRRGK